MIDEINKLITNDLETSIEVLESVMQKQRDFFKAGQTRDIDIRIKNLQKLESVLRRNEKLLFAAIDRDFKKSVFDTQLTELSIIYKEIKLAIKSLRKWSKPQKVRTNLLNWPARCYIDQEPYGVVLIIGAWNYPYQLTLVPLVSALAAGNTVLLKPSELSSQSSQVLSELINENFSNDLVYSAQGGVSFTQKLLTYKFDKIFFTGSSKVGQIVYQAAAAHLTPVTLELGGKSPCVVMPDADLELSAKRIVWGKFLNAGQTCIAPDYLLVHQSIYDLFLVELKKQINLFYGDDVRLTPDYPRIINKKNWQRLVDLIQSSDVYTGGHFEMNDLYIEPTVLKNVKMSDSVMQEEIFGPLLPVISYESLAQVTEIVINRDKPLAFYCFTSDLAAAYELMGQLSFGGGVVNDTLLHIANTNLPFGGVGPSGIGNYHGEFGFKTFTYSKSIVVKNTWFDPGFRYPPYDRFKKTILNWLSSI